MCHHSISQYNSFFIKNFGGCSALEKILIFFNRCEELAKLLDTFCLDNLRVHLLCQHLTHPCHEFRHLQIPVPILLPVNFALQSVELHFIQSLHRLMCLPVFHDLLQQRLPVSELFHVFSIFIREVSVLL